MSLEVVVNGEPRVVPGGASVTEVLLALGIDPERVAVEMNRQIVRKGDWPATAVPAGAKLEIVHFVGGG